MEQEEEQKNAAAVEMQWIRWTPIAMGMTMPRNAKMVKGVKEEICQKAATALPVVAASLGGKKTEEFDKAALGS